MWQSFQQMQSTFPYYDVIMIRDTHTYPHLAVGAVCPLPCDEERPGRCKAARAAQKGADICAEEGQTSWRRCITTSDKHNIIQEEIASFNVFM